MYSTHTEPIPGQSEPETNGNGKVTPLSLLDDV